MADYEDGMLFTAEMQEAVDVLTTEMTAEELRKFCSRNGIRRRRGARKDETAMLAYYQEPEFVGKECGIVDAITFTANCKCGLDEEFDSAEEAKAAAQHHRKENPSCRPRAWASDGQRVYG